MSKHLFSKVKCGIQCKCFMPSACLSSPALALSHIPRSILYPKNQQQQDELKLKLNELININQNSILTSMKPKDITSLSFHDKIANELIKTEASQVDNPALVTKTKPQREYYRRKLPSCCVSFSSPEGKIIFKEALLSGHMDCYFQLAAQFRTQEEPAFCGLSTLVMVLNTLEVDPKKIWKGSWRWYHENMLDCCIPLNVVEKKGITLDQFACLASCNMLQVKMERIYPDSSEERFRKMVIYMTQKTDRVMVVSYSRKTMGQSGDGHFSPIGGYHPERDMVLIMDTARFKYPPHWVSLSLLFSAMQMIDPTSGHPRGFFLLSKNQFNPGLIFRLSSFFTPLEVDHSLCYFLNFWENLLSTDLISTDMNSEDTVEVANIELTRLLYSIHPQVTLLTTQLDTKFAEELTYPRYHQNVLLLLQSLEALPLYRLLCQRTSHDSEEVLARLGKASYESDQNISEETSLIFSSLTPAHFLSVFLLSWPYHHCQPHSVGSNLHKYIMNQLNRLDTHLLQNECALIRQQLTSIIGYNKTCSSCFTDG